MDFQHETVLAHELVDMLALRPGATVIDCTAGGGGHSRLMLERVGAAGKVIGIDQDAVALKVLRERFANEIAGGQFVLVQGNFKDLPSLLAPLKIEAVDGIAADLGVSSPQLDVAERGFSVAKDGPLDMRMDQSQTLTAAHIVNNESEQSLTQLLRDYGDEPRARDIARLIVRMREKTPFQTTSRLADAIKENIRYREASRRHPALRTFQALRIAVNGELDALESLITQGFPLLKPKGRLGIIAFHSLEDRIVKQSMNRLADRGPKDSVFMRLPHRDAGKMSNAVGHIVKPFPAIPSDKETERNPRSHSAKLRVIERMGGE